MNKWTIGGAVLTILVVLLAVAVYWPAPPEEVPATPSPVATTTTPVATSSVTVIGHSVEGRDIVSYTFGTGDTHLLFVGGIHGGYEANSRPWKPTLEERIVGKVHELVKRIPEATSGEPTP